MATRSQARESVIGLLYAYDLGNEEISKFATDLLEEKKIRNKQREFALSLFNGVIDNLEYINKVIDKYLKDWDIDRLGSIERSILRLITYEMLFSELDNAILINEAIELSKKLTGDSSSSKFINGVLDSIKVEREIKEVEK
jgi:N utilization substance protein B